MARDDREVIVVEQDSGGGSLKWLLVGATLGAGLALLFTPRTGKEMRRELGRGIRGLRELADDTLEELQQDGGDDEQHLRSMADEAGAYDDAEPEPPARRPRSRPSQVSAREELERRLAAARARRRQPDSVVEPDDEEEPVA